MKQNKIIILLLCIIVNSFVVYGQNTSDTSNSRTLSLDEVVVSADKFSLPKRNIAQQIQTINRVDIVNSQAQSAADLISKNANVHVQKSQLGGGSPVLRGFEASRIVLYIDGVRMNNIIYRGGHLQNIITLDNSSIDRAEILYGPSSTIYGSDALGGVIHFYTLKPQLASNDKKSNLKINAFTRYGSVNNEVTGHLDFNIGCKKLASLTSITYSKFGDLMGGKNKNPFYAESYGERPAYVERINGIDSIVENSNKFKQVQSAYHQYDILQKFLYQQNPHIQHQLNFQYSNSSDIPRYDRLTDKSGGNLKYAEWYYGPQQRLMTAYDFNFHNDNSIFQYIHAGINYQNIEESRNQRRYRKDNLQHRTEKVNVIGFSFDFRKVMKKNDLRFGLDGQYNILKSTAEEENIVTGEISPLDTRYPDGKNNMMNVGLYAAHTWNISSALALVDGVRIGYSTLHSTFVDKSFFNFPFDNVSQNHWVYSGSLGLIHTPDKNLKLSLLVSTGYRSPNVDDLSKVFESASGAIIVPNPELKPEKTINTEIGITKLFGEKIQWENSIYYTQFFDAIVTDKYAYNGSDSILFDGSMSQVMANQNKQQAYLYGFSTQFNAICTENLSLTAGMSYTYARIKTDTLDYPLDHIPPFMAMLQIKYKYKKFSGNLAFEYNAAKALKDYYIGGEDNEVYATPDGTPAWFTANLHLSYNVWKYITLQAGIENIFDTQYRTFASGINAPGRNIYGVLKFNL